MFKDEIILMNACADAVEWVGDKSFEQAWASCERGDWMLWWWIRKYPDDRMIFEAKARCAELVRHLMNDECSLDAVQAAHDYAAGKISKEELQVIAAATAYAATAYAAPHAPHGRLGLLGGRGDGPQGREHRGRCRSRERVSDLTQ